METYKQDFIQFMVRSSVLTFGDFTTKSGRKTPFFINTGRYRTGDQMNKLAGYYADAIQRRVQESGSACWRIGRIAVAPSSPDPTA